ncbi:hypothetical protein RDI58_008387 [Solanum bulbocastanum]|uniref:Uncharacterized protein n=1 Tax=Solanum bulbocastanum TaxID=147425 RepID=A0AAN8YII8_SOLBU
MAVHKEVSFVAYLLIVLGMFLLVDALGCTKECGNLGFGICPRSEGSPKNPICINCCSGYKGCYYFGKNGKFVCEGESDEPKANMYPAINDLKSRRARNSGHHPAVAALPEQQNPVPKLPGLPLL